jgi:hypothetical protein
MLSPAEQGLLMSFSASEPFLQRLLRPGSPVTPWMPGLLPRTQTAHGRLRMVGRAHTILGNYVVLC